VSFECFSNPEATSNFLEQALRDAHRFLSKRQLLTADQFEHTIAAAMLNLFV
jgi:hypothetical protein